MGIFVDEAYLATDTLCVKIAHNHIFIGIGNILSIYAIDDFKLCRSKKVFDDMPIYGLDVNDDGRRIAIYGGQQIRIYSISIHNYDLHILATIGGELNWVLALRWLESPNAGLVTISMQNTATFWSNDLRPIQTVVCNEQCIAYCAHIHKSVNGCVSVLSGTVFNDVLLWKCPKGSEKSASVRLRGHKGVLFSIDYHADSRLICSSSDDRSTIVWALNVDSLDDVCRKEDVQIRYVLHGHLSRIMKCRITNHFVVSAGEDGRVNVWSIDGTLYCTFDGHQGAPAWSIDCDEDHNLLVTGGSDGAVNCYALRNVFATTRFPLGNCDIPKKICIESNRNILTLSEDGYMFRYDAETKSIKPIMQFAAMNRYCVWDLSPSRKFLALGGFHGDIIIFDTTQDKILIEFQIKYRIFAIHWLNECTVLTCIHQGILLIWTLSNVNFKFTLKTANQLPPMNERLSTCAVMFDFVSDHHFAVGDRRGNVHVYNCMNPGPVCTAKRTHNHLGVTRLYYLNSTLISLGKDSTVKEHIFNPIKKTLQLKSSDKLSISWLTDLLPSDPPLPTTLVGFSGESLILWDTVRRCTLYQKVCGGGHRSSDIFRSNGVYTIAHIKNKSIHVITAKYSDIHPRVLSEPYHARHINALSIIQTKSGRILLVTGGEDTTIRIHEVIDGDTTLLRQKIVLKSHLSSVRCLTHCNPIGSDTFLLYSGGGRAQIICWRLTVRKDEFNCMQVHSYYESLARKCAETRVMQMCTSTKFEGPFFFLYAARSDGTIQIFSVNTNGERMSMYACLFDQLRCILKLTTVRLHEADLLASMATDGRISFWDVTCATDFTDDVKTPCVSTICYRPFASVQANQSGINSYELRVMCMSGESSRLLFITGGDDNAIVYNLLALRRNNGNNSMDVLTRHVDNDRHCAQITGLCLLAGSDVNRDSLLLSAAIDRRVLLHKFTVDGANVITTEVVKRISTVVADVQALAVFEPVGEYCTDVAQRFVVCGKGLEINQFKL